MSTNSKNLVTPVNDGGNELYSDHFSLFLDKTSSLLSITDEILSCKDLNWTDELFTWADANNLPEEVFPRDKHKILSLTKLQLNCSFISGSYLCRNPITEFPDALARLSNLTSVDLAGNCLLNLPSFVTQLPNLVSLDLFDNQLTSLPDSIEQLSKLSRLDLSHNLLSKLPETIGELSSLSELYLGYNHLVELPESMGNLAHLKSLSLFANPTLNFSFAMLYFPQLKHLDLRHNQLTKLDINISQLINLTHLDIRHNRLHELPDYIGQLTNLSVLYLSNNFLKDLPETFSNLHELRELYLCENRLQELPKVIGKLANLSRLTLNGNRLSEFPVFLAQLRNLSSLDLSDNFTDKIPDAIRKLPLLNDLRLIQRTKDRPVPSSKEDIQHINLLWELKLEESRFRKLIDERVGCEWKINNFNRQYMLRLGGLLARILKFRYTAIADEASDAKKVAKQRLIDFIAHQQAILHRTTQNLSIPDQNLLCATYHKAAVQCNPMKIKDNYKARASVLFSALNEAYLHQDLETVQKIHFKICSANTLDHIDHQVDSTDAVQKRIESLKELNVMLNEKILSLSENKIYRRIQTIGDLDDYFNYQQQLLREEIEKLLTGHA